MILAIFTVIGIYFVIGLLIGLIAFLTIRDFRETGLGQFLLLAMIVIWPLFLWTVFERRSNV